MILDYDTIQTAADRMMEAICKVKLPGHPSLAEEAAALMMVAAYIIARNLAAHDPAASDAAEYVNGHLSEYAAPWRLTRLPESLS